MQQQLLATKFHIPPAHTAAVPRPHLLERLTRGLRNQRKVTLVAAPAGYGKTTLVTAWIHALAQEDNTLRVAWLSLDAADNEPARFFSYLLAAFQQVDPSISRNIQPLLELPHLPPAHLLLDTLLNALAAFATPILLTLDDYHVITHPDIHAALDYFINHQPASIHLVYTSRADPPLPLARLRARNQITEIRMRDLRFSEEETRQLFTLSLHLSLPAEVLSALDERTEGWAAGLHLAGLALQHQTDPNNFIATFRGSHRYVLDYLAEEVIRQQGEEIRAFLTHTSILERFNADLCCALTGRTDAPALIAHLEQLNLFIMPLDDERIWYRYHNLFSDYLRTLLPSSQQRMLHKQAARWHEANNLLADAVHYALASSDPDFAADVIERVLTQNTIWSGGNVGGWLAWLDALPAHVMQSRPQLSLHATHILYLAGRFDQAEARLAQIEQTLHTLPDTPATEEMRALAALYRGSIAAVRGDVAQALDQITFAQQHLPQENHLAHARAFSSLGLAYEIAGQTTLAIQQYVRSSDAAHTAGVLFLAIHARCAAAQLQVTQGQLQLATQTCQAAINLAADARLAPLGLAWSTLGGIALERNDLATAERLLQDGIALARQGGLLDDVIVGLAFLARVYAYQGNQPGALALMQDANALIQGYGIERMSLLAEAYLARLNMIMAQQEAALHWATTYQSTRTTAPGEFEELTLAHILLATGALDLLPAILHPLLQQADAAGHIQTAIEGMLLLGLWHHATHATPAALPWLEKALGLAAPEGYTRIFLDAGPPLLDLLPQVRHTAPELVDALLRMLQPASRSASPPPPLLPEPLSEQELRVLGLIVAGKSNKEIAAELVITVGTAKWHVHNILQKLGVTSRPKAIARARELGLA